MRKFSKPGISNILSLIGLVLIILVVPLTVKLSKSRQEIRNLAYNFSRAPLCVDGDSEGNDQGGDNYCSGGKWYSCPSGESYQNGGCAQATPQPTTTANCTNGSREGNDSGGYNYCSGGQWYSTSCPSGQTFQNGGCTNVIATLIISPSPSPIILPTVPTQPTISSNTREMEQKLQALRDWCDGNHDACSQVMAENDRQMLAIGIATPLIAAALVAAPEAVAYDYILAGNVFSSLPAWIQTGVTSIGTVASAASIKAVCDSKGYNSTDCGAALTGLQVANLTQQSNATIYWQNQKSSTANIENIIAKVDRVLSTGIYGEPRSPGCRTGACGFGADLTRFSANESGMTGAAYQVRDLNMARGVVETGTEMNSFQHAFSIVTDQSGNSYIVDLTFTQFVNTQTGIVQQAQISSGISINNPVAQQLVQKGYVPLTTGTLNEYLRMTSVGGGNTATLNILNTTPQLPVDYSVAELNKFLSR